MRSLRISRLNCTLSNIGITSLNSFYHCKKICRRLSVWAENDEGMGCFSLGSFSLSNLYSHRWKCFLERGSWDEGILKRDTTGRENAKESSPLHWSFFQLRNVCITAFHFFKAVEIQVATVQMFVMYSSLFSPMSLFT